MRDAQRQRLYDAEQQVRAQLELAARGVRTVAVAGSTLTLPPEVRFGTLQAVQRYVDGLRASEAFARRFGKAAGAPLHVRARRGGARAHYEAPGTIAVHAPARGDAWALRELVVLHEVAHHVASHELPPAPAHGPGYAGVLLRLVTDVLAPEVGLLLTAAYADHRVRATFVP